MIRQITVTSFRGISGTEVFRPEMFTILTGRNGLGKSTFFDAVDWCLFGESWRLSSDARAARNLYSTNPPLPFVEVKLELAGTLTTIARHGDASLLNGASVSTKELIDALVVDPDVFPPYLRHVSSQVRSVTYLSQEEIRDFVTESSDERKALLRALLGVPNAGVVHSSIKRLRDHLEARGRQTANELSSITLQLTDSSVAGEVDSTLNADIAKVLGQCAHRLKAVRVSLEEAEAGIESQLSATFSRRSEVESALSTLVSNEKAIEHARAEGERLQARQAEIAAHAQTHETRLTETQIALDATRKAYQQAIRARGEVEARLSAAAKVSRARATEADLGERLRATERERERLDAEIAAAQKRSSDELGVVRRAEAMVVERRKLIREGEALAVRQAAHAAAAERREQAAASVQTARSSHASNAQLVVESHGRLTVLRKAYDQARVEHERAVSAAQYAAQIADLRAQFRRVVRSDATDCPLCGAHYSNHGELLRHVTESRVANDLNLAGAAQLLNSADQALREHVSGHEALTRATKASEVELQRLEAAERQTAEEFSKLPPAGQAPDLLPLKASLATGVSELETATSNLQAHDDLLGRDRQRRERLDREYAALRKALDEARAEVDMTVGVDGHKALEQLRTDLGGSKKLAEELEGRGRALRGDVSVLEAGLADARAELAKIGGQIKAEADRATHLGHEITSTASRLELSSDASATFLEALHARLSKTSDDETTERELLRQVRALRARCLRAAGAARVQLLSAQRKETESRSLLIQRASRRFEKVATALEERAKSEAEKAGGRHLAAIQECLDDLYPHRHLNQASIDFTEGTVSLRDRWIKQDVEPRSYSSTGQANVLALSVFLGLALRQRFSRINALLLDEPVQNLDDLHFLAFLTLLKRVALKRQVIISTADSNITQLLRRQLTSWTSGWCEYEWTAFDPTRGPSIRHTSGSKIAAA